MPFVENPHLFDPEFDRKPGKRTREEKAEAAAARARRTEQTVPDVVVAVDGRWRIIAGHGCHWIQASKNGTATAKCGMVGILLTNVHGDRAAACRACIERGARAA